MHLSDCFLELFTFIRYLADSPELEGVPFETVRQDVDALIARLDERAKLVDASPEQFDMARFAVFAWADESVLCSNWEGRREWLKQPLQRQHYGTVNAGEEFFARLHGLLGIRTRSDEDSALARFSKQSGLEPEGGPGGKEVLEVFALCLALGYSGMYFSDPDRGRLERLRKDCVARILGRQEESVAAAFPQAYGSAVAPKGCKGFGRVFDPMAIVFALLPLFVVAGMYFAYRGLLQYSLNLWLG